MANRNDDDKPGVSRLVAKLDAEFRKRDETIASLREELEAERQKFQQETRRTSEMAVLLENAAKFVETPKGYTGGMNGERFAAEIRALLKKPINAPSGKGAR